MRRHLGRGIGFAGVMSKYNPRLSGKKSLALSARGSSCIAGAGVISQGSIITGCSLQKNTRAPRSSLNFIDSSVLGNFSYLVSLFIRFGQKIRYWNILSGVILKLSKYVNLSGVILLQQGEAGAQIIGDMTPSLGVSLVEVLAKSLLAASPVAGVFSTPCALSLSSLRIEKRQCNDIFSQICLALKTAYVVKYKSLDRKLRKIVKNKYRYFRFYSMVKPAGRVRVGLRFILLGLAVRSNQTFHDRLDEILLDVLVHPSRSILLSLKQKHQMVSLGSLALSL